MGRIRKIGLTIALLVTTLLVMAIGPHVIQQMAWAEAEARITLIRDSLEQNASLAQLSDAFRHVAEVVEPSVVHIQVSVKQSAPLHDRTHSKKEWLKRFFGPHGFELDPHLPGQPWEDEDDLQDEHDKDQSDEELDRYSVPQVVGTGSGWVYDRDGHVVTNYHVVKGADRMTVRFQDGTESTAHVVGTDPKTDVAVIKIDGHGLHPAVLAKEPIEQGDIVFAFGSPFGFEFSVSQGIVSAKGRQLGILSRGGYENFIQTDAAINRGNSGGPMTNIYGQVVGMNTAIASRSNGFQGLGFAIPVGMLRPVVEQLINQGKVSRGYLGVFIADLDPKLARTFNYQGDGVLVEDPIEGGPAQEAGIDRGDIITGINGQPVRSASELRQTIASLTPETKLSLDLFRNGQKLTVQLTISELPDEKKVSARHQKEDVTQQSDVDQSSKKLLRKLGFGSVVTLTKKTGKQFNVKLTPGVLVRSVRRHSAAAAAGIVEGQVITSVMGVKVDSVEQLVGELKRHDINQGIRVSVIDGDVERFALLELLTD